MGRALFYPNSMNHLANEVIQQVHRWERIGNVIWVELDQTSKEGGEYIELLEGFVYSLGTDILPRIPARNSERIVAWFEKLIASGGMFQTDCGRATVLWRKQGGRNGQ